MCATRNVTTFIFIIVVVVINNVIVIITAAVVVIVVLFRNNLKVFSFRFYRFITINGRYFMLGYSIYIIVVIQ